MDISINNSNTNFKMAVKLDPNAQPIIKKQVLNMSNKNANKFWERFDEIVERQQNNPVDIIIRKCEGRKALAAEVVDHGEEAVNNTVFSQGVFNPNGLKFVQKAEERAEAINDINSRFGKYTPATEEDYIPGKLGKNLDIDA